MKWMHSRRGGASSYQSQPPWGSEPYIEEIFVDIAGLLQFGGRSREASPSAALHGRYLSQFSRKGG
jgi:hypothetical protein